MLSNFDPLYLHREWQFRANFWYEGITPALYKNMTSYPIISKKLFYWRHHSFAKQNYAHNDMRSWNTFNLHYLSKYEINSGSQITPSCKSIISVTGSSSFNSWSIRCHVTIAVIPLIALAYFSLNFPGADTGQRQIRDKESPLGLPLGKKNKSQIEGKSANLLPPPLPSPPLAQGLYPPQQDFREGGSTLHNNDAMVTSRDTGLSFPFLSGFKACKLLLSVTICLTKKDFGTEKIWVMTWGFLLATSQLNV